MKAEIEKKSAPSAELVRKYNVPGPRYTSYPTVPYWEEDELDPKDWKGVVKRGMNAFGKEEGVSLYIHLPFCESLCTFCGCNKRITKDHGVETPYIESVLKEWSLYLKAFEEAPLINDITLGGGTPTFFSPDHLRRLIEGILEHGKVASHAAFSFEGHPASTTKEHFDTLYELGFRRVSFGIQDFDPEVQRIIHRIQPYEMVERATQMARESGFTSVNYDVIYGLPLQRQESVLDTMEKLKTLRPDRAAYYSYAHVPWIKGTGQRKFSEEDLPADEEKRALYEIGREKLEEAGYEEIGMDHFALPQDDLAVADRQGRLHRNFMGYIPFQGHLVIGLGVSAISDAWFGFAQNIKKVEAYQRRVEEGEIPIFRGHKNSEEDLFLRRVILDLMCRYRTGWSEEAADRFPILDEAFQRLREPEKDDLVELGQGQVRITEKGRPFVRNICMAFDARLYREQPEGRIFSMTV
jgi:oxygen-independent coproporphyrinogen-3 oxidase